jgi:hypothetical protein
MKRSREPSSTAQPQRVVINVGGTELTTTIDTIRRSSFLSGLVDLTSAEHAKGIFLDRDPEIFAHLLRLMRQYPHIAGLMPSDPQLCASVIAEADYFGFDSLLAHVKVQAYFNSRDPKDDYPSYEPPVRQEGESWLTFHRRVSAAFDEHRRQCKLVDNLFEANDEGHALSRFDLVYGDIGAALRSGALPRYFLERKPPKPVPIKKIVQVIPTASPTWFLVGHVNDPKYGFRNDYAPMARMESVVAQPARVLRVACQALVEDERGKRWLEPMVHLAPADLAELMCDDREEARHGVEGLWYGVNLVADASLSAITGGGARRTMLASDWLENMPSLPPSWLLWTYLLVAEVPPFECGFETFEVGDE